ncbi:winged helix-turn-helix domain-containing protein [Sinorhizobium sp. 7-81]|uniref:ATP-binding protein n=1 Tax=Sinorhizobium sp. 8-89 TaxID=3049089 RepID=UPI0024C24568|nr:winged helix-turn-helix domain-containing protein [Sinorhizobium sp. 8-89]MDK1493784.1 winged helix-turn-helix domain-containing protein [Sinorhizobium sp. 8-89]
MLLRDGQTVSLGSRAAEILVFLAQHPGAIKTNAEIIKHVWPDTFVEEANLRVHISALRKALDDTQRESKIIANVPGRGYTFIAKLSVDKAEAPAVVVPFFRSTSGSYAPRIFGREQSIVQIATQLRRSRLLTIVGPGGIGKSTVARAVMAGEGMPEAVWIDLSEVTQAGLIPTTIASALGILARSEDIVGDIADHLASRELILVLDSCEQAVDGVAPTVEAIMSVCPAARILATSREPLRAEGERVHRLPPLEVPTKIGGASDALASPAVQLFVERADACLGDYELTDEDAPYVVEICSQLDGIALAIELAAGRLEAISVQGLAASLSDCFRLLTRGRRTALPRHQTLRATLDWSYTTLSRIERTALQELSVFRGWFSGEAAAKVLSGDLPEDDLASLVSKSLVSADTQSAGTRYRLLDTTRIYAAEKLVESDGTNGTMSRLAGYLEERLGRAEQELYAVAVDDWSEDYASLVANLRAALDWSFGAQGDKLLGVRLTVAGLPLLFRLSLLDECFVAVTRAINFLESRPGLDERSRMKLYAALGWPQMRATDAPEYGIQAWSTALKIAEEIGDVDHQLRAIWALWVDAINRAQPGLGMEFAERFGELAVSSTDPTDTIIGRRMRGATLHWLGRHAESCDELRQMLREYSSLRGAQHSIRFQFDQRVTARIILARALWVLGEEAEALREVRETVDYALDIGHTLSLSNVLAEAACPIALLSGRDDLAADYIAQLKEHTKALSLDVWHCYADCFEAELMLREGRAEECVRTLRVGMETLSSAGFTLFMTHFQSVAARAMAELSRHSEALRLMDDAIEHCGASGERWCLPELYRVKAAVILSENPGQAVRLAMEQLALGADAARHGDAPAWKRRIDRDLAALSSNDAEMMAVAKSDASGA